MDIRIFYKFLFGINLVFVPFFSNASIENALIQPADSDEFIYAIGVATTQNASIEDAKGVLVSRLQSTVSSDITVRMQSHNGLAESQMMSRNRSKSITLPLANVDLVEQVHIDNYWHSLIKIKRKTIKLIVEDILLREQKNISTALADNETNKGTSCFFAIKEFKPNFERLTDINSLAKSLGIHTDIKLFDAWQKLESRCLDQNLFVIKPKGIRYPEIDNALTNSLTAYRFVDAPSQLTGRLSYQAKVTKTKDSSGYLNFVHFIVVIADEHNKSYLNFNVNTQGYSFFSEEDATANAVDELIAKLKNKME